MDRCGKDESVEEINVKVYNSIFLCDITVVLGITLVFDVHTYQEI